jgi:UDP-N-acetylglucosamine:LPS N-acetylglucosamine transferase
MVEIARTLPQLQLILMCGRHARLAQQLRALPGPGGRRLVVEFTEDVPAYMGAADFFIGKPGPGCLSEALQLGLPIVTWRPGEDLDRAITRLAELTRRSIRTGAIA